MLQPEIISEPWSCWGTPAIKSYQSFKNWLCWSRKGILLPPYFPLLSVRAPWIQMKCQESLQAVEIHRCLCRCHRCVHAIRFNYICAIVYNCCCFAFWKDNVRYLKVHRMPLEEGCFVFSCHLPDEYWNNVLPKRNNRKLIAVLVFHLSHSIHSNVWAQTWWL